MSEPAASGLWGQAWRRMRRDRAAMIALAIVILIALVSIAGPWFSPYAYDQLDWGRMASAPSLEHGHWLGTDRLGRDLFVRTLLGVRVSLAIGLLATLVSLAIGVTWGCFAGYLGGRTDELMMRFVDVLYALPYIFVVIILTTVFDRGNLFVLFVAIGAVGWLTMARIVRGQALALRQQAFIDAAITLGLPAHRIIARHIVPNVVGTVVVYATLTVPQAILQESFLSFLGIGVKPPLPSWGTLASEGLGELNPYASAWWLLVFPCALLGITLLALNFVGEGLRKARLH